MPNIEAIVVGGGAAGLFTALSLQHYKHKVALIAPPSPKDTRTTALMQPAIMALKNLGLYDQLVPYFTPLSKMRLIDETNSLLKAPEITFSSDEIQLEAFGYNIENAQLTRILRDNFKGVMYESAVTHYETGRITLQNGTKLEADYIIAADGRNSFIRQAAKIGLIETTLPQVAFTCIFTHSRPHDNTSTEFHTDEGPMTFVPMTGDKSSLVWVMKPEKAKALKLLDGAALAELISKSSYRLHGRLILDEARGFYPLTSQKAKVTIAEKLALIGEAAHVLPPIGAQGLNISFRDGAFLAEAFQNANPLEVYAASRHADVLTRQLAVDALNQSLLSNFMPIHAMRAISLSMINRIPALRQFTMKQGLAPAHLPQLML